MYIHRMDFLGRRTRLKNKVMLLGLRINRIKDPEKKLSLFKEFIKWYHNYLQRYIAANNYVNVTSKVLSVLFEMDSALRGYGLAAALRLEGFEEDIDKYELIDYMLEGINV